MATDPLLLLVGETADRLLTLSADPHGTPLRGDGFEIASGQLVQWSWGGEARLPSNWASQQNWARTMVGLSALTGNPTYAEAARAACRHVMAHLRHPCGLIWWGGHMAWDMKASIPFGHAAPDRFHHELKTTYPYLELMYEADAAATAQTVEAIWRGHILDWRNLDFNRHGAYFEKDLPHPTWDMPYAPDPVFFVGQGLSFTNAGSDLFYAAAMLHHLSGDPQPLVWAERMAHRYIETRDPGTGLSGYQFSQVERDRCQLQFGPEHGARALEGKILDSGRATCRYAYVGLCQLQLGETMGAAGQRFLTWAHEDLTAFARHVYDADSNRFQPMWTDGERLSPEDVKRPGYYSPASFEPWQPQPAFLRAYALAWRLTGDPLMWEMARAIARGHGLGDLGSSPTAAPAPATAPTAADTDLLLGVLELWRGTRSPALLELAGRLGENLVAAFHHHGIWSPSPQRRFARIDGREGLALLHLVAARQGMPEAVPVDRHSRAAFTAENDSYPKAGRWNRIGDDQAVYNLLRN